MGIGPRKWVQVTYGKCRIGPAQNPLFTVRKNILSLFKEGSKIMVPPNHQFVHRVFHYFHHPFWGFSPYFWKHPFKEGSKKNQPSVINGKKHRYVSVVGPKLHGV